MTILAPSLLGADFKNLERDIKTVEQAGAKYLHLDVMDGAFVPSISFGMPLLKSLRSCTDMVFDVHMMVEEPARYTDAIRECGADLICIHAEACRHLDSAVNQIRLTGAKAGIALNPATPLSAVELVLPLVHMVLIMSVNPGFGGQKFIPYTLEKVRSLRTHLNELGLGTDIQVDGGVTLENAEALLNAGANILVAGTSVFKGDAGKNAQQFLEIFEKYEKGSLRTGRK